jgi:hypothetical protein
MGISARRELADTPQEAGKRKHSDTGMVPGLPTITLPAGGHADYAHVRLRGRPAWQHQTDPKRAAEQSPIVASAGSRCQITASTVPGHAASLGGGFAGLSRSAPPL